MDIDFKKKKKYGQNFLTSDAIPARIAAESGSEGCGVIEIGPGFGILTRQLLQTAKKVVAVEIDDELVPILNEKFGSNDNFLLINDDILNCDISNILKNHFSDMEVCVCANLPYYVTTPILMKLLEGNYGFKSITVMVQREVADRIVAKKGSSENSALTVVCSYYAAVKKLFGVSAGSFSPPPKVNSAVVRFDVYSPPPQVSDTAMLFAIIKAAFSQRRKTLVNSIYAAFSSIYSKSNIEAALIECGIKPTARAEELDITDFIRLTDRLNLYHSQE